MRILVTGGVRSGKSRHAESLLDDVVRVRYVAPGPVLDDADWRARVAAHRLRRPSTWDTHESGDLATALGTTDPVLVDCLGTWVTRFVDDAHLWDAPIEEITGRVDEAVHVAVQAMGERVVLVTNEVGLGVVPAHRSGRVFRDLLGSVNQRFGAAVDEVHLVVAGRVLRL
ncbi:bifunctional adenosylcobinamide kinase/adenosylcobinamide-phosphate guanylyltransferase [Nocardioides sp.]|uniref:bifunctional adenosylcobinamide kinase/adenosylcobinamide-phosphate guanylyltransferase n=1 Tax=Nocardioides sp. TaxID=35761 RepID=UPI002625B23F|nr:bifunctional adenosylcobinamide kinase/adenosylcobinamide-phosphate guanylyltransferase [Nocardioides sp.]